MVNPAILQLIDYVLLASGCIILVGGPIWITLRRQWAAAARLPPVPANRLEATDVFMALICSIILPALVGRLFILAGWDVAPEPSPREAAITLQKLIETCLGIALAIGALLAIGSARFENGLRGWGLTFARPGRVLSRAVIGYLVAVPVCFALLKVSNYLLELTGHPSRVHATITMLLDPSTPRSMRILAAVNAIVLAATAEELLFRGILLPALAKWSQSSWIGILVSSALFGLIHAPYYNTVIPLAAFGVILGYLYARTGSLSLAILTHAIFNGKTVLWILLGASPD